MRTLSAAILSICVPQSVRSDGTSVRFLNRQSPARLRVAQAALSSSRLILCRPLSRHRVRRAVPGRLNSWSSDFILRFLPSKVIHGRAAASASRRRQVNAKTQSISYFRFQIGLWPIGLSAELFQARQTSMSKYPDHRINVTDRAWVGFYML